jgi:hypothetical protein
MHASVSGQSRAHDRREKTISSCRAEQRAHIHYNRSLAPRHRQARSPQAQAVADVKALSSAPRGKKRNVATLAE